MQLLVPIAAEILQLRVWRFVAPDYLVELLMSLFAEVTCHQEVVVRERLKLEIVRERQPYHLEEVQLSLANCLLRIVLAREFFLWGALRYLANYLHRIDLVRGFSLWGALR